MENKIIEMLIQLLKRALIVIYGSTLTNKMVFAQSLIEPPHLPLRWTGINNNGRFWPDHRIPFIVEESFTEKEAKSILTTLQYIQTFSCLEFKEHDGEESYLLFKRSESRACGTDFGYEEGIPTVLDLGKKSCFKLGTLMHEILHGLGFAHEHARHDRDNFVNVIWEHVPEGKEMQFKKLPKESYPAGGPYDFYSIMHYPLWPRERKKIPDYQTLEPIFVQMNGQRVTLNKNLIGQRSGPTPTDLAKIRKAYNCTQHVSSIMTFENMEFSPVQVVTDLPLFINRTRAVGGLQSTKIKI